MVSSLVPTVAFALAFAFLATVATAAGAQKRAETDGERGREFADVIEVRVVEVEVAVTDAEGNRVPGLTADDFRLLVDGEPVAIDYFGEVRGSTPVATEAVAPLALESQGGRVSRSLLVFVDDYFTDRRYRGRLLKNLQKTLDTLGPGDRMAVVRFEGWGLEVISEWSDDREALAAAVQEARSRTPADLLRRGPVSAVSDPEFRVRVTAEQIRETTTAMAVAMRVFADAPGRKILLPVTAGWPYDPTLALAAPGATGSAAGEPLGDAGTIAEAAGLDLSRSIIHQLGPHLLAPMTDAANRLGFTIYPLQAGDSDEVRRTSLWAAARDTGGHIAALGGSNPTPLAPVVEDTASYYVLAFTATEVRPGHRYELAVESRQPGLDLRHRRSFLDLTSSERRALEAEQALLLGEEGGDLQVTLGEIEDGRRLRLPVTLTIPMDWVTLVPDAVGVTSSLSLRVAALDERGGRSELADIPIELSGAAAPEPGSHALYDTVILLRDTEQRLVLQLDDELSGESLQRVIVIGE